VKLLDTNVIVYARQRGSPFHAWATGRIAQLVSTEGAGMNVVSLSELCAEPGVVSADVPLEISNFGVQMLDLPAGAAVRCGEAYRAYKARRKSSVAAPKVPLPDFFIGAHAELLGLDAVTNDPERFRTYFPKVHLVTP